MTVLHVEDSRKAAVLRWVYFKLQRYLDIPLEYVQCICTNDWNLLTIYLKRKTQ